MKDKLYTGEVTWFNSEKGYGFIKDDNGDDHYVHYTEIIASGYRTLTQGNRVEFSVGPGNNDREQAVDVVVIQ